MLCLKRCISPLTTDLNSSVYLLVMNWGIFHLCIYKKDINYFKPFFVCKTIARFCFELKKIKIHHSISIEWTSEFKYFLIIQSFNIFKHYYTLVTFLQYITASMLNPFKIIHEKYVFFFLFFVNMKSK